MQHCDVVSGFTEADQERNTLTDAPNSAYIFVDSKCGHVHHELSLLLTGTILYPHYVSAKGDYYDCDLTMVPCPGGARDFRDEGQ